jgi:uncharacterized protein (DUF2062 family)
VRAKLTQLAATLSRLPDTPERVALAFAVGVFFGFSPFLGLQTLLGIAIAFSFRLSRVAVLLGTWVNLPFLVPVYYAVATEMGARLLGREPPSKLADDMGLAVRQASLSIGSIERVLDVLRPMLLPFVLGSTLGGLLLGGIAYWLVVMVLRARRVAPSLDQPEPAPLAGSTEPVSPRRIG